MEPEQEPSTLQEHIALTRRLIERSQRRLETDLTDEEREAEENHLQNLQEILQDFLDEMDDESAQQGDGLLERDPTILPPDGRKLLEQIGNEQIKSIKIVRTPLSSFTKTFLNILTLGQFDKISKTFYDEIFHLSIWINDKYNLEKNEVIAFNQKNPIEQKSETKQVQVIPAGLTFQTLIDKTKARMGDKFGPYNAESNNCQDFITNIFKANNIGDDSDFKFIKQDTKEIFSQLPEFSKVLGNLSTKLGAIFNRLIKGEGQMGGCDECMNQCSGGDELYNFQLYKAKCKF